MLINDYPISPISIPLPKCMTCGEDDDHVHFTDEQMIEAVRRIELEREQRIKT